MENVKVRMLATTTASDNKPDGQCLGCATYERGQEYEVSPELAKNLVLANLAEPAKFRRARKPEPEESKDLGPAPENKAESDEATDE